MAFYDVDGNVIFTEYSIDGEVTSTIYNVFGITKKRPVANRSPKIRSSVIIDIKDKIVTLESLDAAIKNQRDLRQEGDDVLFQAIDEIVIASPTNDYENLINKPKIESNELIGNKTFNDLNMTKISINELESFFSEGD